MQKAEEMCIEILLKMGIRPTKNIYHSNNKNKCQQLKLVILGNLSLN
jgi:hypothetical protein